MLKTAIECRNKNKNDCFVLKIAIGCRNKNKNDCFVLFRLESAAYFGEIPKEGEGNTKKKGQMKVNEENGRLTAALKDMVGIGKEANGGQRRRLRVWWA